MKSKPSTLAFGCAVFWITCQLFGGETNSSSQFGFDRIISGWTNYSTAFNTTHETGIDGEHATVASFFTPAVDVRPTEFGAVMVWFDSGGQRLDFGNFVFEIHFWSSLDRFIQNSRLGDVAAVSFPEPTGGSTTVPDAITRGGRAAYQLRFDLTGSLVTLTQCHTYLVGVLARATSSQAGELYVPTAPFDGLSDVQAGNVVPFGWIYLLNAGGQTIYSGQLATELVVQALGELPRLSIQRSETEICLDWPEPAACYTVESSDDLSSAESWISVQEAPQIDNGLNRLCLPAIESGRWYRLRKAGESTPVLR